MMSSRKSLGRPASHALLSHRPQPINSSYQPIFREQLISILRSFDRYQGEKMSPQDQQQQENLELYEDNRG